MRTMSDKRTAQATAIEMANRQREISVSEYFLKNRHLLGFDTPSRAVVTAVKEAVDNALDACEEAGILPDITVELADGHGRSRIVVEDNGPGIAAEDIARLGRPFEQGCAVMANGMKGSGLGLAIANSLVELHGGTLRLKSRPGQGATALVTLPRVQRGSRTVELARVA